MPFLQNKAALLLPLLAAMLYAMSAIALKASSNRGLGTRRTIVICNIVLAVGFLMFYDWSQFPRLPGPHWPVVVLGTLAILGQLFTILAFAHGEISSVTPVFGVKVVIVSFFAAAFADSVVAPITWLAAVIAAVGIACLQASDSSHGWRRNLGAMCLAFCAAGSYAAVDTMNQYWSPILGFGNLIPPAMIIAAALSLLLLIGEKRSPTRSSFRHGAIYLAVGAVLFTLQSIALIRSIGAFGNAASANVVYGSRGLWGIAFVWLFGRWFANHELQQHSRRVIAIRIFGAVLIAAAITLVFL